jgi:hypothetical protein
VYKEAKSSYQVRKRKAALEERERDLKLKRIELDNALTAAAELAESVKKETTDTQMDLKKLREDNLDDDQKMSVL